MRSMFADQPNLDVRGCTACPSGAWTPQPFQPYPRRASPGANPSAASSPPPPRSGASSPLRPSRRGSSPPWRYPRASSPCTASGWPSRPRRWGRYEQNLVPLLGELFEERRVLRGGAGVRGDVVDVGLALGHRIDVRVQALDFALLRLA